MRKKIVSSLAGVFAVLLWSTAEAQRVHEIRLEANAEKEVYRFAPANISARAGDVLL